MQEIVPRVRRLAVMADGNPGTILETNAVQAAARTLGLDVVTMNIRRAEEIAPAFDTIKGRVDAVYICAVPLVNTNRVHISALALAARLPTVNGFREAVEAEALMSYGPNFPDLFRRTADYVEKILRGGKPADIPVEQPTKYDLVVNLKTAKALGLTIHESFLLRADEVIE
jgi:putative ABC transport system substrate-binding protein